MEYALPMVIFGSGMFKGLNEADAARGQAKQLDAAQDTALDNARISEATAARNAEIVHRQYADKVRILRRQQADEAGRQELLFGASGGSGGSADEALMATAARHEANVQALTYTGEVDEQNQLWEGNARAWAYNRQASMYGMQAKNVRSSIGPSMWGSFLEGGATAWMAYDKLSKDGLSPGVRRNIKTANSGGYTRFDGLR